MLTELTISRTREKKHALDMEYLYQEGIDHVRHLCKEEWTDHNIHDPGVTILEVLCYALTDLSYRANLPIEDLLIDSSGDSSQAYSQPLFTAREILHNRPLTLLDYRRLLIDLPDVRNAWIKPASLRYFADPSRNELKEKNDGTPGLIPVNIRGLYKVLIDYDSGLSSTERNAAEESVTRTLHRNRNLCEDFSDIETVRKQNFILCGEIELEADADISLTEAQILHQVQSYLSPPVASYSLVEMQEKTRSDGSGYTVDEIFEGPPLDCGFIPEDELVQAELREEIRLSDIFNIIMDIPGVVAVRGAMINRPGADEPLENPWLVPVSKGMKAHLVVDQSRLLFYKQDLPVLPNAGKVKEEYQRLSKVEKSKTETLKTNDFPIPAGRFRNPGDYLAVQNHLPEIYGLGEAGLPADADGSRKAEAMQLKAYLLFFEQILANYLAQLAHVSHLFSDDSGLLRTYQYQVVESFKRWQEIYDGDPAGLIEQAMESSAIHIQRRNRFLDHLIARFAEQFSQFAHTMFSMFEMSPKSMVRYRCDFLRSYPAISRDRGLAYNYTLSGSGDIWDSDNTSGLQRRVCKLLGISNCSRRNLKDIDFGESAQVFTSASGQIRFHIRDQSENKVLIRSSRQYASEAEALAAMRRAIRFASLPAGYARKKNSVGKFRFNIVDEDGGMLARGAQTFATEELMESAIEELMLLVRNECSDEGMYLVENILLRPDLEQGDPFLKVCMDPGCQDCPEADPYSYRLQIILPAYGARFGNMDFRNYAEQVIRAEVPAHILPRICWVSEEDMAGFEVAYQDWLKLKCGKETSGRQARLTRFFRQLGEVKNIYPAERLHECDNGETPARFIVGKRALGSMKTD